MAQSILFWSFSLAYTKPVLNLTHVIVIFSKVNVLKLGQAVLRDATFFLLPPSKSEWKDFLKKSENYVIEDK